ncbi:acetaldehyde dehydrogenase (acetylating) [Luteitalea sp. TBR-22]|uniref:aldehyde dehydrogenase family protein n=1 Tax=Luteitalea sp. TBR-22 TaxID=2802971 RepID=UPI001AF4880F|nr:aldehyde dehydrogenase family protein [Luteitalea sp. TBR-22]BCS33330.1 acetaldehyde dehydrogenase (acetylating) [Luteitalea sp. TBR-22]
MADVSAAPPSDKDLASIAEARALARAARLAQAQLAELSQAQIDAIVDGMAAAVRSEVEALARMAREETGFGVYEDKITKNRFVAEQVYEFIRPMKTVGVLRRDDTRKIIEIAEPFGVVAGIVPTTNPTSTAMYKILIALKARCAIVLSPHPSAARCISRTAEIMAAAAARAGAPANSIGWMQTVTLEGTQELMRQREVAVILATGGLGLVRAAYSAGKPAYGVGPGNAPCYVHQSADVPKAARDIILGKTFDNGLLCSSPNSIVADRAIDQPLKAALAANGGHFLSADDAQKLAGVLVTPQRLPNPALVGRTALEIAQAVGLTVPAGTRALIAQLDGVGRDYPLSIEKLCPVLSYYVVDDWKAGCERCKAILRYGGMGHTMSVHATDDDVVLQFGLHKPAFRIVVNTPTTHGSVGLTTGLDPAMTLGCGGYGGNITSDNISPMHLLNIKRVAYELRPAPGPSPAARPMAMAAADSSLRPAVPERVRTLDSSALSARIDGFLASRGITPATTVVVGPAEGHVGGAATSAPALNPAAAAAPLPPAPLEVQNVGPAVDFVCEDDVRQALRAGQRIRLAARAIVTPAARELGDANDVFVDA